MQYKCVIIIINTVFDWKLMPHPQAFDKMFRFETKSCPLTNNNPSPTQANIDSPKLIHMYELSDVYDWRKFKND